MFIVLPNAARVYHSIWLSPRGDRCFGARLSPRPLLHRLLLDNDGALVCGWRHESLLDRGPFGIDISREGDAAWSACPATCRDCLHSRRRLVADAGCLIPCLRLVAGARPNTARSDLPFVAPTARSRTLDYDWVLQRSHL